MANIDNSFNKDRLASLFIKEANLININLSNFDDNFYFEDPIKIITLPTSKNTIITVTAKAASDYYGTKTLRYNRIHISDLPTIEVEKESESNIHQLLYKINLKYGLFLTTEDVDNDDITSLSAGLINVNLNIKDTSLIFYSGIKVIIT